MQIDYQQARKHLELLTGSSDALVTFQVLYDPKDGTKRPDLAAHFNGHLEANQGYFDAVQTSYCGIFVCINETDGQGREASNVTRYRTLFADFDGIEEPQWPVPPHFVTKRDDTHGHAYWLVSDLEDADLFRKLQRKIALCCDTDKQVYDPSRVARICGTPHYKDPANPAMYRIATDNSSTVTGKYTVAQIEAGFVLDAQKDAELTQWLTARDGIKEGTGYDDQPRYVNQFKHWCEVVAPIAVQGSGTLTLIRVASWAHDHGISYPTALKILWEHYNPRCEPPWQPFEQRHFSEVVERAYQYATSAAGCKTATAQFQALGEVPEPIGGWEANAAKKPEEVAAAEAQVITVEEAMKAVVTGKRMDELAARDSYNATNGKTGHYLLAKVFDGMQYKGCELFRWGKIFYTYNGKCWQVLDDDRLKSIITCFYDNYDPSTKFVNGIYDMLGNLVTVDEKDNNTWISEPSRDASCTITFDNGIADVSAGAVTLMPHTSDFFSLNKVDYNYDATAQCPTWLRFLDDLWPGDTEMKMQLQEWFGYCLTQDVARQKFAVFVGKSRGGKGVIADVLSRMIGDDRVSAPALEELAINASKYSMSRSRLTLIPDAHSVPLNKRDGVLSMLKAITGCDKIEYDIKYKTGQSHVFLTHIVLSTNNMPEFLDSSGALVNRMLIFPFWKTWAGKENVGLRDALYKEMAGIVNWAIAGLQRLTINGKFTEASAGVQEKEDLREDMFRLHGFITDYCTVTGMDSDFATNDELYFAYSCWAAGESNMKPVGKRAFTNELRASALPVRTGRKNTGSGYQRGFTGIKITKQLPASNVTQFPPVEDKKEG